VDCALHEEALENDVEIELDLMARGTLDDITTLHILNGRSEVQPMEAYNFEGLFIPFQIFSSPLSQQTKLFYQNNVPVVSSETQETSKAFVGL
jgi:hypothetical protein